MACVRLTGVLRLNERHLPISTALNTHLLFWRCKWRPQGQMHKQEILVADGHPAVISVSSIESVGWQMSVLSLPGAPVDCSPPLAVVC